MKQSIATLVSLYTVNASVLLDRQSECSPASIEPLRLMSENLLFNNLGGFSSKFCENAGQVTCGGDICCSEDSMTFTDVLTSIPDVDLVITNATEYLFRSEIPTPPNGLVSESSDLPQINLRNSESVDLLFKFPGHQLDFVDFTFFDLDIGELNALEEVTVCSSEFGELYTFFVEEDAKVDVTIAEDDSCVTFTATTTGFAENNPVNSNDPNMEVRQLAGTIRMKDVSEFVVTYKISNGPEGKGRNFLFTGNSFLAPEKCATDAPTKSPVVAITDAPTKAPVVSHVTDAPTKAPVQDCDEFHEYVQAKRHRYGRRLTGSYYYGHSWSWWETCKYCNEETYYKEECECDETTEETDSGYDGHSWNWWGWGRQLTYYNSWGHHHYTASPTPYPTSFPTVGATDSELC